MKIPSIHLILLLLILSSLASPLLLMPPTTCAAPNQDPVFCKPTTGLVTTVFSTAHQGIDISGASGSGQGPAVYAVSSGTVVYIGMAERVQDNPNQVKHAVAIDHGLVNGKYVLSLYVHMGSDTATYIPSTLQVGTYVQQGQLIGYQGVAGLATGTHLHWEIHEYNQPFLSSYSTWGINCNRTDLWWEFGGNPTGSCHNSNPALAANPELYAGSMPYNSQVTPNCANTTLPLIHVDSPAPEGATVYGVTPISGWAIHQAAASGTGVNYVHVYLDGPIGSGAFLGQATYGIDRSDVGSSYGERYRYSGYVFDWDTRAIEAGQHTLYIYAHSTTAADTNSGWYVQRWTVNVQNPLIHVDSPAPEGATVYGVTPISGWAIHQAAASGTGVNYVHVYLDGPIGSGAFLGQATYGIDRSDVGSSYGERYRYSGYVFDWDTRTIEAGQHTLYIYAHSTTAADTNSGWYVQRWTVNVQNPLVHVDSPSPEGATVYGVTPISGWAIHQAAGSGTGVNYVHVYLDGPIGSGAFLGQATYGIDRSDVGSSYGERYRYSGYVFDWDTRTIEAGQHTLYIYAHSTTVADTNSGWYVQRWTVNVLSKYSVYVPIIIK